MSTTGAGGTFPDCGMIPRDADHWCTPMQLRLRPKEDAVAAVAASSVKLMDALTRERDAARADLAIATAALEAIHQRPDLAAGEVARATLEALKARGTYGA